jgi:hypothetical protein
MSFDKTQALAVINSIVIDEKPIKVDQQQLAAALDELFAKQAEKVIVDDVPTDKTVTGIDFHVYGGPDDHTSDLDEKVVAIYLIAGVVDQRGDFHEDAGHPSVRVPILA